MAKLTNRAVWHVHAGGTGAASDRSGYDAFTTIGRYMIEPISSPDNAERHIGYRVLFCNHLGKLECGLYQSIHQLTTLPTACRMCQEHMVANGGRLIPEQIPS